MTGIDRLRTLAGAWDEWGLGGTLAEMADQIERELQEERDRWDSEICEAQMDKSRVTAVYLEMNKHVLGHEGMEDSPVARWARELRGALKSDASDGHDTQNTSCADPDGADDVTSEAQKVTRDPAEDVSMSAYDLLPADERDAIAWVRDHGGLDYVKREWRSRVPHDRYEARRQRLLGHIAECETALGRRREIISNLGHRVSDLTRENAELRRRAMPEGVKWPRYESGELIGFGDEVSRLGEVFSICLYSDGSYALNFRAYSKDECVKRPEEVLAADGEPLEVGQTVWSVNDGREYKVVTVESPVQFDTTSIKVDDGKAACGVWIRPDNLTHQRPVLDADGVPIKKGDTVYWLEHIVAFTVVSPHETHDNDGHELKCGHTVEIAREGHEPHMYVHPESLHHTKPEPPDSWDALWDDIEDCAVGYESFMRRCRAMAERERGE